MKRRYRTWGGNPRGDAENITRCIESVADGGRSCLSHQCYRKRGHGPQGLFCRQHGIKAELGKSWRWNREQEATVKGE